MNSPRLTTRNVDFSHLQPHIRLIAATQLPTLFLSALLLDGGRSLRVCIAAILAHWAAIGIVCARAAKLSPFDRLVLRWGFFPCLAIAGLASMAW